VTGGHSKAQAGPSNQTQAADARRAGRRVEAPAAQRAGALREGAAGRWPAGVSRGGEGGRRAEAE